MVYRRKVSVSRKKNRLQCYQEKYYIIIVNGKNVNTSKKIFIQKNDPANPLLLQSQ